MNLERSILDLLDEGRRPAMAERTLQNELNLALPETITIQQLHAALADLERKGQVFKIPTEDVTKWGITTNGRARLRE